MTDAELVAHAYELLVTSAAPGSPADVAKAALAAANANADLPPGFGSDPKADGAWVGKAVGAPKDVWDVVDAMARGTKKRHTNLARPQMLGAMGGIMGGGPTIAPGIAMFRAPSGEFVVERVAPGGGADRAGIRAGDMITSFDGLPVYDSAGQQVRLLRHAAGDDVPIEIVRDGSKRTVNVKLAPAELPLCEHRIVKDAIGVVALRFWMTESDKPERDAAALVRRALADLEAKGARKLVLDVRTHPGGAGLPKVFAALSSADVVMTLLATDGTKRDVPRAKEPRAVGWPIAILVDDQSASAVEMLAVALREHEKARIVGQPTSGALTTIKVSPLRDGHMLISPGERVCGPVSKKTFDGDRLVPDVVVPNRTPSEIVSGKDPQLDAAVAALA